MANRFWFELERTGTDEENDLKAAQACRVLERIGIRYGNYPAVWWDSKRSLFAFTTDETGCFVTANDNGHWYNLDYWGRENVEPVKELEAKPDWNDCMWKCMAGCMDPNGCPTGA